MGKSKAERDADKLEASTATTTTTIEMLAGELEVLEEDLEACVQDLNAVRSQVEKAQEFADVWKEQLGEMKAELDEKMALINKFRANEVSSLSLNMDFIDTQLRLDGIEAETSGQIEGSA